MDNGSHRFFGVLVRRTSFLFGVADARRCGVGDRQLGHLGVLSDARWAASGRKVVRPAKRLRKYSGRNWASANWIHSRLDRSFSSGDHNYRNRLLIGRARMGVFGWRVQAGDLATGSREFRASSELVLLADDEIGNTGETPNGSKPDQHSSQFYF